MDNLIIITIITIIAILFILIRKISIILSAKNTDKQVI